MKKQDLFIDICLRFAEESHCLSKKVACLAIKDDRIIASGINGTCEYTINCDEYWKQYYLFNCISEPFDNWIKSEEWRELHHKWSDENEIHAEQNMIAFAARNGISLKDSDIIVSLSPCIHCAKLLISLKPKSVYYINKYDKGSNKTEELFLSAGIKYEQI